MQDNKIHTFGEFDPGAANAELLERFRERTDGEFLLKDAVRVAYPDLPSPTPVAEQPTTVAPADTVAQYSATAALSQQVDSLRL